MNSAARRGVLYVCSIMAWEIATLVRKGRLLLDTSPKRFVEALLSQPGISEIPVDRDISLMAGSLPDDFHGDPADRLIVSTAIIHGLRVVTRDERIIDYAGRSGAFPVIVC